DRVPKRGRDALADGVLTAVQRSRELMQEGFEPCTGLLYRCLNLAVWIAWSLPPPWYVIDDLEPVAHQTLPLGHVVIHPRHGVVEAVLTGDGLHRVEVEHVHAALGPYRLQLLHDVLRHTDLGTHHLRSKWSDVADHVTRQLVHVAVLDQHRHQP